MSPTSRELLLAYRWPAAVVVSSVVLAATAIPILSKPIPIRIEGGLQVDKLVLPASVTIRSNEPLPVAVREDVVITGTPPLGGSRPSSGGWRSAGQCSIHRDACSGECGCLGKRDGERERKSQRGRESIG